MQPTEIHILYFISIYKFYAFKKMTLFFFENSSHSQNIVRMFDVIFRNFPLDLV